MPHVLAPLRPLRSRTPFALVVLVVAGALAVPSLPTAAHTDTTPTASVRAFGAVGDGVTNDTAALQRANDDVAARGGGVVEFPAGVYVAAGVRQDSNVELRGIEGATIKHPDGVTNTPIVQGRVFRTKGTIGKGSLTMQVTSAARILPGAVVGIRGAGGGSDVQVTTLAAALTADATSLSLTQPAAWTKSGTNFVLIDDEILSYTGISGTSALSLKRGLFGTARADHALGAYVSQLSALYARVTAVRGTAIDIDRPAVQAVLGADVFVGSIKMTVRGLTLDGNRIPGGSPSTNPFPLEYSYARWVTVTDSAIRNGDHGAVSFDQGTSDSHVARNVLVDNGSPGAGLGATVWLFRGATNNVVGDNTIGGDSHHGVIIDDRSVSATEWDAPANANKVRNNVIDIPSAHVNSAIFIAGSNDTEVTQNKVRSTYTGLSVIRSTQGLRPVDAQRTLARDNTLHGHTRGIHVTGSNNRFERNVITETTDPVVDTGINNTFVEETASRTIMPTRVSAQPTSAPTASWARTSARPTRRFPSSTR